ncbi:hypothetical protein Golax_017062 [Gossypium laxum]|uniref:Uncharacterized protein n=1 Tax=Gossypium laxum TaxID=34288 RepID=A0A7J8YZS5_9ROSI|nr:hypothetical protein [Gossypium laxum]
MESGGHISLRSIVGEDNDSEVTADEYAGDFATSNGVDNVADEYAGDFATLMDWIMLLLYVVEKRRMGMRLRYRTQMNMEAWLGPMKMKSMKMVKGGASFPCTMIS